MNLFRSEERIEHWLGTREPGATIHVTKLSELAHAWWDDRLGPDRRVLASSLMQPSCAARTSINPIVANSAAASSARVSARSLRRRSGESRFRVAGASAVAPVLYLSRHGVWGALTRFGRAGNSISLQIGLTE